jgi:septal ring factor EnvC (AmiA/AmiB activator)
MKIAENDQKLSDLDAEIKSAKEKMNKLSVERNETMKSTDKQKKLLADTEHNKVEADNKLRIAKEAVESEKANQA